MMRTLILIGFLPLYAGSPVAQGLAEQPDALRPAVPISSGYRLVWHDEFEGDTLDPTKWGHRFLGPRRDAVNNESSVTLDGEGHLLITTSRVEAGYGAATGSAVIPTAGRVAAAAETEGHNGTT